MDSENYYQPEDETQVSGSRSNGCTLVVSVEGNIGSGKSTFLSYCSTRSELATYPEPVEKWRDVRGENLLVIGLSLIHRPSHSTSHPNHFHQARFYENPNRWAMTFQMYVNLTVLDIYKAKTWKPIKIIERSLLSSRNMTRVYNP